MLDSRRTRLAVRAALVVPWVCATGAACASPGEGVGPSAFTSTDSPPVLVGAGSDAASSDAMASRQSLSTMADGCPDVTEGSPATQNDAPPISLLDPPDTSDGDAAGDDASSDDASAEDAFGQNASGDDAGGPSDDDGGPPSTVAVLPPLPMPGDLVISEIMFQPSGPEPESEWFEIYNQSSAPRLLSGLTIQDGYLDTQVIGAVPVVVAPPGQYLLLVRSWAGAQAAQLPSASIVYAYGYSVPDDEGIELDAGPFGELTLLNGQTVLADVPYGQWSGPAPGQSIELAAGATTESDPSSWCVAENPWAVDSDDGTPGAPSDCP